ncbi:uncharacterized protein [Epargyreus clarus]|uniref:uncharacterized protein n=1 Tax=Epargyreus clarus TaxID=520877 RepID=UPI003C2AEBD5
MARREILIILVCVTLVYASEAEESEQKKRGATKTTALNAIPTGAQKPDYTYNIYSQNPSTSSPSSQSYQAQVPNSFYPNQASQYYLSGNQHTENVATHAPHQQINYVTPQPTSQFVPLNFIPNPGYQTKYQLPPPKSNGNIQLAIIQQPSHFPSSPFLQYPQSLFSSTPTNQVGHPNPLINSVSPQGHFNYPQSYQPLSLGNPYLSHPSAMVVVPQASPPLYNNLLYPSSAQSFYNYYPSNSQAKYSYYGATPASQSEYDKGQSSVSQSGQKEENDLSIQNAEYITPADATSYKSAYSGSRPTSYNKIN